MARVGEIMSADGAVAMKVVYVDPLPPLDKDGKTVYVKELTPEKWVAMGQRFGAAWVGTSLKAVAEKFGKEVWEIAAKAMEQAVYEHTLPVAKKLIKSGELDVTDARSIGRLLDFEDAGLGTVSEWVETGKKRAAKRHYYCSWADTVAAVGAVEVCTYMMMGAMDGFYKALREVGARLKDRRRNTCPLSMPCGSCVINIELED